MLRFTLRRARAPRPPVELELIPSHTELRYRENGRSESARLCVCGRKEPGIHCISAVYNLGARAETTLLWLNLPDAISDAYVSLSLSLSLFVFSSFFLCWYICSVFFSHLFIHYLSSSKHIFTHSHANLFIRPARYPRKFALSFSITTNFNLLIKKVLLIYRRSQKQILLAPHATRSSRRRFHPPRCCNFPVSSPRVVSSLDKGDTRSKKPKIPPLKLGNKSCSGVESTHANPIRIYFRFWRALWSILCLIPARTSGTPNRRLQPN